MAHYAQTVNVIGAIKTTRTAAEMEATGLVLQLYRAHYGQIPLPIEQDCSPCDVAAALTKDGKTLTIGIMNPTESVAEFRPSLAGASVAGTITRLHVTGPSPTAHNSPGKPRLVDIHRTGEIPVSSTLSVPPLSCAVFSIPLDRRFVSLTGPQ
jgi:alpha-N-arabinofuranosidase